MHRSRGSKGGLRSHIEYKKDNWSIASKKKLEASIRHKMKKIYVGILDALDAEKQGGNIDKEAANRLRSKVLNLGNDQIRIMEIELQDRYNVEFVPYHITIQIPPQE